MAVTIKKPEIDIRRDLQSVRRSSYFQQDDVAVLDTATHIFDFAKGDMQAITAPASGSFTLALSNFVSGEVSSVIIDAINWGGVTVFWPNGLEFPNGMEPALTASGTDRLYIVKDKNEVFALTIAGLDIKGL